MSAIKKSILAIIFIGFGVVVLLTLGNPIGPFLFAFGLLSVCYLEADLFTGKAGYYWRNNRAKLAKILIFNLIFGYLFGFLLSYSLPELATAAISKVAAWDFSLSFFIRAIFCGMIMYICVELYKRGTNLGIIFGIPLFIFCGFQHCIANIIIMGIAQVWSWSIVLAILGNLVGSIIIDLLNN